MDRTGILSEYSNRPEHLQSSLVTLRITQVQQFLKVDREDCADAQTCLDQTVPRAV